MLQELEIQPPMSKQLGVDQVLACDTITMCQDAENKSNALQSIMEPPATTRVFGDIADTSEDYIASPDTEKVETNTESSEKNDIGHTNTNTNSNSISNTNTNTSNSNNIGITIGDITGLDSAAADNHNHRSELNLTMPSHSDLNLNSMDGLMMECVNDGLLALSPPQLVHMPAADLIETVKTV